MSQVQANSNLQKLLSDALGYDVAFSARKLTKRERLEREIIRLEKRQVDRIRKGRTRGAGAGGFNRDVENISHQIRLVKFKLSELTS